ncbi:hypothetical protein [Streptomyces sp. AN091965]|uniref:hypothetical protein n=1 Tax=Streptomyces sp. AN091965 TaxID=2927803 RepID=UPI001F614487|nr:hypothetical protein [Streptomyces sp. AN091965]MCI3935264.1 hypothetical protein [Streptomyces sp. AN091965]
MQQNNTATKPGRRRAGRFAVAVAAVGVLVGGGIAAAGSASASTFCGATGDGGYGCVIDQGDGTFKMVNSNGDIVYNW